MCEDKCVCVRISENKLCVCVSKLCVCEQVVFERVVRESCARELCVSK